MSDANLPPDDELVSAHLDGEATPAESARVLGDPAAAARVQELAAIRELVAAPVTPPSEVREAALGAALALFDDLRAAPGASPGAMPGAIPGGGPAAAGATGDAGPIGGADAAPAVQDDELAARRAAAALAARRASRNGRILAAAAVFLVALVGIGVVVRASRTGTETTAATSAGAPSATTRDAASGAASKSADDQSSEAGTAGPPNAPLDPSAQTPRSTTPTAPTTTVASAAPTTTSAPTAASPGPAAETARQYAFQPESLGSVSTPAQLRARVVTAIAGDAGGSSPPSAPGGEAATLQSLSAVSTCDGVIRGGDGEVGPIVFSAPVTYDGTDAVVLVYSIDRAAHPAANGGSRLYAVDAATCAVLDVQTS